MSERISEKIRNVLPQLIGPILIVLVSWFCIKVALDYEKRTQDSLRSPNSTQEPEVDEGLP